MSTRPKKRKSVATLNDNYTVPTSPRMQEYYDIVSYCRPAGSKMEEEMITRFIEPLGVVRDDFDNLLIKIGDTQVLWSCHTDTVHSVSARQKLTIDTRGMLGSSMLKDAEGKLTQRLSNCLGADCSTGVWLMIQMIRAKVPGLYIFHREEEVGGRGSSHIKKELKAKTYKYQSWFDGINYAIAFDRYGLTSIISRQSGGECCSQTFVNSLADILNTGFEATNFAGTQQTVMFGYKADRGGTFTDTANYMGLISECTNISVGYYSQHRNTEYQDLEHMDLLLQKLLQFDESKLVHIRDASKHSDYSWYDDYDSELKWNGGYYYNNGRGNYVTYPKTTYRHSKDASSTTTTYQTGAETRWLYHLVRDHPAIVSEILEELGFDYDQLRGEIKERGGCID